MIFCPSNPLEPVTRILCMEVKIAGFCRTRGVSCVHMEEAPWKGRGAKKRLANPFEKQKAVRLFEEGLDLPKDGPERTRYIEVFPKQIISKNDSPDVPFNLSINPYQGCEHGCPYCYARNSHEYWGYEAGLAFEQTILVKKDADKLLEREFQKESWVVEPIMLSGNTDCYQPAERLFGLTRSLLKIFARYQHPVALITKHSAILEDLDILQELGDKNLVHVAVSLTTLNEELRRNMEPRTATVKNRLKTIRELSNAGIPVHVNLAPIIPALNSDEVFELVKVASEHGARSASYIMVRLNGRISEVFEGWIRNTYPLRADKALSLIKETHDGKLNESRWGSRMKGEGRYAEQIAEMFRLARKKYLPDKPKTNLRTDLFLRNKKGQLGLF